MIIKKYILENFIPEPHAEPHETTKVCWNDFFCVKENYTLKKVMVLSQSCRLTDKVSQSVELTSNPSIR